MKRLFPSLLVATFLFSSCHWGESNRKEANVRRQIDQFLLTDHAKNGVTADGRNLDSFVATSEKAMISSEGEAATRIGLETLKKGGNAVDAAIAVSFAISVLRPHSTGIGGGGFLVLYLEKEQKAIAVDMRERAPLRASRDMYVKNGEAVPEMSRWGSLSIATPGLVAGLWEIYDKYASKKIPWKDLVLPSAKLAREGFPVYSGLAEAVQWAVDKGLWDKYAELKKLLSGPTGKPLKFGEHYQNENLAKTLEIIAEKGASGFYSGAVAQEMIRSVRSQGGILGHQDLQAYQVKSREPIHGTYRGYDVISMSPPSSGGIHIVQMLNMFENLSMENRPFFDPLTLHIKAEVMRRAFADRSQHLGDPDFYPVPVQDLLSKEYAKKLAAGIQMDKASKSGGDVVPGIFGKPDKTLEKTSTTNFSIVDGEGNAVASTQTINYWFGSGIVAGTTGIIMNDEMDDFSAKPGAPNIFGLVGGEANSVQPGKTPLSSMSPTIVLKDKKVYLVVGSPGGPKIINAVLGTIVNVLDHHMSLRNAVFAPRLHHQWLPDQILLDKNGFSASTLAALKARGHAIEFTEGGIGNVTAVIRDLDTRQLTGVADPRAEGMPIGL